MGPSYWISQYTFRVHLQVLIEFILAKPMYKLFIGYLQKITKQTYYIIDWIVVYFD